MVANSSVGTQLPGPSISKSPDSFSSSRVGSGDETIVLELCTHVYCGPLRLQKRGQMRLQECNYVCISCMHVRMYITKVVISFYLTHTGITHSSLICWCDPFDQTPRLFKQVGLACETTPNQPHMPSSD